MGMAAILFNDAESFKQIDNTPSTEDPMWNLVIIGQAFQRRKHLKIFRFLYHVAKGQGQITLGTKFW